MIDEENITLNPLLIKINKSSVVDFSGVISQYMKNPYINLAANGKLYAIDLKQILGKAAEPFISATGVLPLKFSLSGDSNRKDMICQIKADRRNYITPVDIQSINGQQSILQAKITFKGDRLNIKDTGLFVKTLPSVFGDDFDANIANSKEVAVVSGTIYHIRSLCKCSLHLVLIQDTCLKDHSRFTGIVIELETDVIRFPGLYIEEH